MSASGSSISPLTFTGTSQYAASFQGILTRAVGIASIPLQELQSQDQTILSQETQLASLQGTVESLTTAVKALGTLGSNQAIAATSSNTAAVTVAATGANSSASYTINSITSLASAASETSLTGFTSSTATQVSTTGIMSVVLGSQTIPISLTPATNNLIGLEAAINASNSGVTATILTTGSGNFLSISSVNSGATTLQLFDDPTGANTSMLTSSNQGSNAVFTLNNLPVTRSQNTINDLISGATMTLQASSTTPVTITLAPDPTKLSSAIQTLVGAYNAALGQVNAQAGISSGVLSGDSTVYQLESDMQQMSTYKGSGSIKSLADMGITFASNGSMSFDSTVVSGFSSSQIAGSFQFFGSASTGFGGLSQALDQVGNASTGTIATEQISLQKNDANLQAQISKTVVNINSMQKTLFQQLAIADTLISTLDTQQSLLSASIQSLNYTLYGAQTSNGGNKA